MTAATDQAYCISTLYENKPWPCVHGYTFACPVAAGLSPSQQTIDTDEQFADADVIGPEVQEPPPKTKTSRW